MNENSKIQATITGAIIVVLLQQLDSQDKVRESVIRLKERLIAKIKKQPKEYAILADEAYEYVKNKHIDSKLELDIGILIEGLANNKMAYMQEMFGMDIIALASRASAKITLSGLTKQQGRDSWDIADDFKESIEKHSFEYLKGEKQDD